MDRQRTNREKFYPLQCKGSSCKINKAIFPKVATVYWIHLPVSETRTYMTSTRVRNKTISDFLTRSDIHRRDKPMRKHPYMQENTAAIFPRRRY